MAGPDEDGIIRIDYLPREQFIPFHNRTQRWACIVAHRRAGKTVACIHDLQRGAIRCADTRPRFAYVAPFRSQAKAVAWDYLRAAAAPLAELGVAPNESELRIDYHNRGQVRLYGADNIDALRGIYLDGVVLDEYGDIDPRLWPEVIRPALADRKGWAVFIGTPKGRNDFYRVWAGDQDKWVGAKESPDWYSLELKASETKLIDAEELAAAKNQLSEEQYQQEFECSFDAAIVGAYYGKLINQAEADKRITGVPYDPAAQVWTAWDLGIADATAIWWCQVIGREIHIIDYYEASGADLGHYVKVISEKPYIYAGHIVPHDAQAKELGTGKNRLEVMESLGLRNLNVCTMHRVEDGINAVRVFLPRCWFDKSKCDRGIEALKVYRAEWDDKLRALRARPVHDWASHAADAFRYLAMTMDRTIGGKGFNRKIEYPNLGTI